MVNLQNVKLIATVQFQIHSVWIIPVFAKTAIEKRTTDAYPVSHFLSDTNSNNIFCNGFLADIGTACSSSSQCTITDSTCANGVCSCQDGYVASSSTSCLKGI